MRQRLSPDDTSDTSEYTSDTVILPVLQYDFNIPDGFVVYSQATFLSDQKR
jgi:hypothetical protein